MDGVTYFEGFIWICSMMSVAVLAFVLSYRLSKANTDKAAMPKINAQEGSRLFFIFGINYAIIAVASAILSLTQGPQVASEIAVIMREWWLVEIFIFFNIITTYCLYTAVRRIIVNV
jgi:hypothetical protein